MSKKLIYNKALAIPIDRVAARVLKEGEHYEPRRIPNKFSLLYHSETPLPIRPTPVDAPKLVGITFGRLSVIGLHATVNGLWVVRCTCGNYEGRRTKAILNPKNKYDRCAKCEHLRHIKSNYHFLKTGKNCDSND